MLEGYINLFEVHPSIVVHKKLTLLNLKGCKNLNFLPSKIEMESLDILILPDCSKIKRIPEFMRNMESLWILHLDSTSITKLPSSIKHLINLASLNLSDYKNHVSIPSIIFNFIGLEDVNVAGCLKFDIQLENFLRSFSKKEKKERNFLRYPAIERPLSLSPEKWKQLESLGLLSPNSITSTFESLSSSDILDLRDCNHQLISGNQLSTSPNL